MNKNTYFYKNLISEYKLLEKKDHLIDKLDISEDEKQTLKNFFKKYPNYESKIDWNRRDLTFEDFKELLASEGKSRTQAKKRGLGGLIEGRDYIIIEQTSDFTAYQPLTYEGSKVIASNKVPPIKENGAKWCTAYQKTDGYWDKYTSKGIKFCYVCTSRTKYALALYPPLYGSKQECYSFYDTKIRCPKEYEYLYNKKFQDYPLLDLDSYYLKQGILIKEPDSSISCLTKENCKKVKIKNFIENGRFTIKFNKWAGDFSCDDNNLTSLEGAPREVRGSFDCSYNKLTSLEGAPKEVGRNFDCSNNELISLEGAPRRVGKGFICSDNNLTSLRGAPEKIDEDFWCSSNKLTSLEGAPREVGGSFNCYDNNLTFLKGAPREVGENFDCGHNKLTSLRGAPREIEGSFSCDRNNLTSLEGAPGG